MLRVTETEARVLRAQLKKLGLSQRAAAGELDITERTMRRYCSGEASVPRAIVMALHLIELALGDEKQKKWLADRGVRMAYVRPDGSDLDVTDQESARLGERSSKYRKQARKIVKSSR